MDPRIHDVLTRAARLDPAATAATLGTEEWSFGELDEESNRAAHRLAALGVGPGDRVVWWGPTGGWALVARYGASKAGAAFAPLNPAFTDSELEAALDYLRPSAVLADRERAERASALGAPRVQCCEPGWLDGAAAMAPPRLGSADDPSTVYMTSGSTGAPKAVIVSHRAEWLRAVMKDAVAGPAAGGGQVVMFGLFHMAGWWMIEQSWTSDRAAHLVARADASELLDAVERHRATTLYCIPAVWQRILEHGGDADTSSLREVLTGTSYVDPSFLRELKERFPGTWTSVAYGSTEICRGAVLFDHELERKPGSVGRPHATVEAGITEEGELLLRGPTMFSGYLDRPEETAAAIDAGGWYHTGDLVTRDEEGYLHVVGRRSEQIRSGGEWISPVEVETVLRTHPAVEEVAVFGVTDPAWGEVVCAAVVVRSGHELPTVEELRRHAAGELVPAKHPRQVIEVDQLPLTPSTGQVRRAALRDRYDRLARG